MEAPNSYTYVDNTYADELPEDLDDYGEHRHHTEIDNLLDDFFVAKMRVVSLEQENLELKQKIDNLQRWKEEIERVMMNDTFNEIGNDQSKQDDEKKKSKRHKTEDQVCFEYYCKEHKKDNVLLQGMLAKMSSMGYVGIKKVPWALLKLELKTMFDNLVIDEKTKYLDKAREHGRIGDGQRSQA